MKAISITSQGVKLNLRQFLILYSADELYVQVKKDNANTMFFEGIQSIFQRFAMPVFKEFNLEGKGKPQDKKISRGEFLEMVKR